MRAAARGSEELMSTGALISMEWRLFRACAVRWVMLSAVKEWRFLAFFLPSARRWMALAEPLSLAAVLGGLEQGPPAGGQRPPGAPAACG